MKNRCQRTEDRGQRSDVRGQMSEVGLFARHLPLATCHPPPATRHSPLATCHLPPATRHSPRSKRGFSLVEVILATSISIMVFVAMGSVLVKSFALWKDAAAHWRLAQVSRISRERILCGAFSDPSGGFLAASNVSIVASSDYLNVGYQAGTNYYGVSVLTNAYTNTILPRMYLVKQYNMLPWWAPGGGCSAWGWGVRVGNSGGTPDTTVDAMTAVETNDLVIISYSLNLSAGGKTFSQLHTIRACLVNKED